MPLLNIFFFWAHYNDEYDFTIFDGYIKSENP